MTTTTEAPLVIDQGSNFTATIPHKNADGSVFDLTGYTAHLQVKATVGASDVFIDASTANGKLIISAPTTGVLTWVIVPADTTTKPIHWDDTTTSSVQYMYELKIIAADGVSSYSSKKDTITIKRQITHS
jgi:hypothetical protein